MSDLPKKLQINEDGNVFDWNKKIETGIKIIGDSNKALELILVYNSYYKFIEKLDEFKKLSD